jgi:hypothetical protein
MFDTLILAGLVLSIVQVLKMTFKITSRYIPVTSLGVMVFLMVFSWFYLGKPNIPLELIIKNTVAVLTAMGMWSGVKNTLGY